MMKNKTESSCFSVLFFIVVLDDEVLELDFLDIHSGRVSRGHRFLGHEVEILLLTSKTDAFYALNKNING